MCCTLQQHYTSVLLHVLCMREHCCLNLCGRYASLNRHHHHKVPTWLSPTKPDCCTYVLCCMMTHTSSTYLCCLPMVMAFLKVPHCA